jgi:hypothetical protein
LPHPDDARIPVVVAWMDARGHLCVEDPGCLPESARYFIAEMEARGITTPQEMFARAVAISDPVPTSSLP